MLAMARSELGAATTMPSLFRFLLVVAVLIGLVGGGLYALANFVEPPQQEVVKPIMGVKVKKP